MQTAYEIADRFTWTASELEVYDYWSMKAQDERGAITLAHEEGHREGHGEGHREGLTDGKVEVARNMLQDGMDAEAVVQLTGLSPDIIVALANESTTE